MRRPALRRGAVRGVTTAVLRARTFVGMKRAADMHAREEVLRVLRSVRPDLRAMKAGDFASLAELLDLAKQTVLQVTAPLMPDVDRAVATADVVALVASARELPDTSGALRRLADAEAQEQSWRARS